MAQRPADDENRPTNHLAGETSPYLQAHARNPVDWYPWGPAALQRAREEDRPIFLSIGYNACHWCHVMERESFENPAIAELMNRHFVNIKVDREERPDLDQIYMAAVQAMTRHGGWPMSVFLTPDLRPFYGGTYFPPRDSRGMPGFDRVLEAVAGAWSQRREEILQSAGQMVEHLQALEAAPGAREMGLSTDLLDHAFRSLSRAFEPQYGGFGSAPKFPHAMDLRFLLRYFARTGNLHALHMVRHTLDQMARGGIFDHLGGGFARYSTDERWLVPHFEKMLYDNALLASTYLEAYQVTHDTEDERVARATLDYVLGRMTGPEGGFYATEDADSEGVEGKYYVWTLGEVESVLGADRARVFSSVYDVTAGGNWEGHTILNQPERVADAARKLGRDLSELSRELDEDRMKLLAVRERRVPPALDTKVLVSWNGLMIAALADAGPILKEPRYTDAARRAAGFVLDHMRQPDGRLWHAFKDGQSRFNGYLDDYACLIEGLVKLFEATGEGRWIGSAIELATVMLEQFEDREGGGFYYTGRDHETLIVRQKDLMDNATPSGNAMAATGLLRLAALTGREEFEAAGRRTLELMLPVVQQYPSAAGQGLIALDFELTPPREVAIVAADEGELRCAREVVAESFSPATVIAPATSTAEAGISEVVPLLAGRSVREGKVTAYICTKRVCEAPVVGLEAIAQALHATVAGLKP